MTRCWIARHEFLALQEEALEKRKVMAEIARKEKEARQKGQKGGKKPPPKKAPQRQKVQQQRSLISVDGQPSGELGRIYMAAPKDKHLAMLPSNRMPVSCLQVFKRGLILLRMLLHDSGYAVCGVCVACGTESCARLIFLRGARRIRARGCDVLSPQQRRQLLRPAQKMWVASTLFIKQEGAT